MKTRVIQNEPDQARAREDQVVSAAEPRRPTNPAGATGRWSRQRGKIAVVLLLATSVLAGAFLVSRPGGSDVAAATGVKW